MCGRYSLAKPPKRIRIGDTEVILLVPRPRYNVAPMQRAPVIRLREGLPVVDELRWGLIPAWAKDAKLAASCINARSETVATKPAFRAAFKRRRCLVPADGFFEWQTAGKQKLPWWFVRPDGEPLLFAGLWESWQPAEHPDVHEQTFTLLTTRPNAVTAPVHDRMPVALSAAGAAEWLRESSTPEQLAALCVPLPDDALERHRVSQCVNSARNDGPECIAPVLVQSGLDGLAVHPSPSNFKGL